MAKLKPLKTLDIGYRRLNLTCYMGWISMYGPKLRKRKPGSAGFGRFLLAFFLQKFSVPNHSKKRVK